MKDNMLKRVVNRAKKLALLLLLIPILTAGIAYYFAAQTPKSYQATSKIMLGNFENEYMTNGTYLKDYYTSEEGLKSINQKYNLNLEINTLMSGFSITPTSSKPVNFSFRGGDKEVVEKTLVRLTDAIMQDSTEIYQIKVNEVESRINYIEAKETETEPITQHQILYYLNTDKNNLKNSELIQDVKISESNSVSPSQRAVLGLLIGLVLSLFILILPELFKEQEKAV